MLKNDQKVNLIAPFNDFHARFNVIELQSINKAHVKAIWVMKMSPGGKVLASAGDDKNINIWVLKSVWDNFVEKYYLKVRRKLKISQPRIRVNLFF